MENIQALFIDWLTLYGSARENITWSGALRPDGDPKPSMFFNKVQKFEILLDGRWQTCGVVCSEPTTPQMDKATISFKVANHILYREDYYDIILKVLTQLKITAVHIARIDVAADFLRLANGWDGAHLARELAAGYAVRKGSRKVKIFAKSPYHIHDDGTIAKGKGGIESITFGTHASVCQFQLYNKTEELRQQSMGGYCPKEYIRDCWKKAGVWSPEEDTWRIELRLSSKAHSIVNMVTGQLQPIGLYEIRPEVLKETILAIFSKWAEIRSTRRMAKSDIEHFTRLPRIVLMDVTLDKLIVPKTKPEREGLPASGYIKGIMTTIERFRNQFNHLLPDQTDRYILGDALSAIKCIYSEARTEERQQEVRAFLKDTSFKMLDIIEMRPEMTKSEEHYFAYIRAVEQWTRDTEIQTFKNQFNNANNQRKPGGS